MYRPGQRRPTNDIPVIQYLTCPACKKPRLPKQADNLAVSIETVEVRGEIRYLDVCRFCIEKYHKSDERFMEENMRKLAQAMKERDVSDKDSDHTDFSLDM